MLSKTIGILLLYVPRHSFVLISVLMHVAREKSEHSWGYPSLDWEASALWITAILWTNSTVSETSKIKYKTNARRYNLFDFNSLIDYRILFIIYKSFLTIRNFFCESTKSFSNCWVYTVSVYYALGVSLSSISITAF